MIALSGIAVSPRRASNSCLDLILSQYSAEPDVTGTVVVTTPPEEIPRIAIARPTKFCKWSPESMVSAPGADESSGKKLNGFSSVPGLAIVLDSAPMNLRWLAIRSRSERGVAALWKTKVEERSRLRWLRVRVRAQPRAPLLPREGA